jgi:nucleoside 2-deoxyribosyltransferase
MSSPQVFISYSSGDADWARSFAEALKQHGVGAWLDQFQVAPGDSIRDALEAGLRNSDVFVALIDPRGPGRSSVDPNLYFELGAALGMGKKVVAVVPREIEISQIPFDLRSRGYIMRDSPEETAEELAHALIAA